MVWSRWDGLTAEVISKGRAHTMKPTQDVVRVQSSLARKSNHSDRVRAPAMCWAISKRSAYTITCLLLTRIRGRWGSLLALSLFYRCGN